MLVIAALLLIAHLYQFFGNLSQGILRALDLYPPEGSEAIGYDVEKFAEYAFILWVGYKLIRRRNAPNTVKPAVPQYPKPDQ